MSTKLSIANFKSIRQLDLDCKKINLFIGEPNTGKSNILEALALLSWCGGSEHASLSDYIRLESTQNLFYDQLLDEPVEIKMSTTTVSPIGLRVAFENGSYLIHALDSSLIRGLDKDAHGTWSVASPAPTKDVKFFRFRTLDRYGDNEPGGLKPPDGPNLFSVVLASKALRGTMAEFFRKYGLMLVLKSQEGVFELQKHADGLIISYPYSVTSDTLRRVIFYTVAIVSNKDSVLVKMVRGTHPTGWGPCVLRRVRTAHRSLRGQANCPVGTPGMNPVAVFRGATCLERSLTGFHG